MARPTLLTAGLLLCIVAAASAAHPTAFLADTLANSKGSVKAKTSSGYYGYADTEVACLQQLNYKSCRYTNCITAEDAFPCYSTVVFQTDFTCCPKEQHYGHNDNIGELGFSDKVGTCDWEISVYRWSRGNESAPTPIYTDDGTALKFGTAWGTCYLNSEAEHCDDPLCERMAISIQGGIYVSKAYSDNHDDTIAPSLETCINETAVSTAGQQSGNGNFIYRYLEVLFGYAVDDGLCSRTEVNGTPPRRTSGAANTPASAPKAPAAAKPAQAKIANDQETSPELYAGCGIIISGPFYETSKHDSKIEETGLFEFALAFSGGESAGTEPANRWPVIRAKSAKLRFTREHDEGYGHEEGSA